MFFQMFDSANERRVHSAQPELLGGGGGGGVPFMDFTNLQNPTRKSNTFMSRNLNNIYLNFIWIWELKIIDIQFYI